MNAVDAVRNPHARSLQGVRAGFVSRFLADLVDWLIVVVGYLGLLAGYAIADHLLTGAPLAAPAPPVWFTIVVPWLTIMIYLTAGWGSTGRTIGKSLMGLRVVTTLGAPLRPGRAFLRAALCDTVPAVLLWVIVSRKNKGAHDILLRTSVVYDWTRADNAAPP